MYKAPICTGGGDKNGAVTETTPVTGALNIPKLANELRTCIVRVACGSGYCNIGTRCQHRWEASGIESSFGPGGIQALREDECGEQRKCKHPLGTNNPSSFGTCVTYRVRYSVCNAPAFSISKTIRFRNNTYVQFQQRSNLVSKSHYHEHSPCVCFLHLQSSFCYSS